VHAVPAAVAWFNLKCATSLFPLLADAYKNLRVRANDVRVSDAFIVRYDADGGQASYVGYAIRHICGVCYMYMRIYICICIYIYVYCIYIYRANDVRVSDAFVVRYDVDGGQARSKHIWGVCIYVYACMYM